MTCPDACCPNKTSHWTPRLSLIMKGGHKFDVLFPTFKSYQGNRPFYCLAIGKHDNINIIGHYFFTGYNIVFDRERGILGWEQSKCRFIIIEILFKQSPCTYIQLLSNKNSSL
ncbi:unnamed protein product [Cuscuta epithymum]|uniref:Peptidase A1 domain-containing protein n=1 Tax=Cuscuta epithymum TaxID=186058 RepID=A0AAV0FKT0_9ASTE|nr:unnamed protein product [Cuscuta epithymum]